MDGSLRQDLAAGLSQQLIPNVVSRELGTGSREFLNHPPGGFSNLPEGPLSHPLVPGGFPRRTEFTSSMDSFNHAFIARPNGILPMSMNGLPEFIPQRSDHSVIRNSFERNRKPSEMSNFVNDSSFTMFDNNHHDKFRKLKAKHHKVKIIWYLNDWEVLRQTKKDYRLWLFANLHILQTFKQIIIGYARGITFLVG